MGCLKMEWVSELAIPARVERLDNPSPRALQKGLPTLSKCVSFPPALGSYDNVTTKSALLHQVQHLRNLKW